MKQKHRKVAFVGSTAMPVTTGICTAIVDLLRELPPRAVVLTRGNAPIERFIANACTVLDIPCFTYPARGFSDNWNRDVDLARDADEVIALIASDTLPAVNTGTAHLIEKAIDLKRPVRAFSEVGDRLVYAGATDD